MSAYNKITSVPYRYIDKKPGTPADRQFLTDVFECGIAFLYINASTANKTTVQKF